MTDPVRYSLEVCRAEGLTCKSKEPKLHVKVQFGTVIKRTRTIKGLSPVWNESFTFSSSDASTLLDIRIIQQKRLTIPCSKCIGSVKANLEELLHDHADEASLRLMSGSSTMGTILIRFRIIDLMASIGILVQEGKQAIERRRLESTEAAVSALDGVNGDAVELSGMYDSITSLFLKLDAVAQVVDEVAKVHPFANLAWQSVSLLYKVVSHQVKTDHQLVELVHIMNDSFDFLSEADKLSGKIQSLGQSITKLLEYTVQCSRFIEKYVASGFSRRIFDIDSNQKINEFKAGFVDLKDALNSAIGLHTAFAVSGKIIPEQQRLKLSERLKPVEQPGYNRRTCFEDTRVEVQKEIMTWLTSVDDQNIVWLYGVAGSGKSTVATTIENHFRMTSRLGAFLSFERGKSHPCSVIRTLAYKLAMFDQSIASHVVATVEQDNDIAEAIAETQFEKLLLDPLSAVSTTNKGPVIIVLDALDECGTADDRVKLLIILQRNLAKVPKSFRFLITSRREPDIAKSFLFDPCVHAIELDYTSPASKNDVLRYIDHEMRFLFLNSDLELPFDREWDENIAVLGETAQGLFVWASTAIKYVAGRKDDPLEALDDLVSYCREGALDTSSSEEFTLDKLYDTVMQESGISWTRDKPKTRFAQVLSLILLSKVPVSISMIDGILGFSSSSRLIVRRLQSVISLTSEASDAPVRLFHTSFADYLISPARQKDPWFIDVEQGKVTIASRCFDVMAKDLHFNMCGLEDSSVRNDDVPELSVRVKDKIPPVLEYTCHFWAEHLRDVPQSCDLLDLPIKLSNFAKLHLLYWFEVLSLTKSFTRLSGRALRDAVVWAVDNHADILTFLRDAYRIASIFAVPISQSTPHIYVSALSLTKGESIISDHYSKYYQGVGVHHFGMKQPFACIKTLEGQTVCVHSVAFSPDGRRIVSGAQDCTIYLWDAESAELLGTFEGHLSSIYSVTFSPDGKFIASGSQDYTIRIWNIESNETISGPFEGHTSRVTSLEFSQNGKRIMSAALDNTIRVWDIETGETVLGPLQGHSAGVTSVALSRDGAYIASGSFDSTILIWDSTTGDIVSGPFKGHKSHVNSVAFSSDGTRIVSGSQDATVRIWDVRSGKELLSPIKGKGIVNSVAFSPDGQHVVSGDQAIHVWETVTGREVSAPFGEIRHGVCSVAYSPDGKRLVTGGWDCLVRVWDVEGSDIASGPFDGHTSVVESVAVSPDGGHVVSGSWDGSIRVWDRESGAMVSGPMQNRTSQVCSVGFATNGKYVVSCSISVAVWDIDTGRIVSMPYEGQCYIVNSAAFFNDGIRVVLGGSDGLIEIWNTKTGEIVSGLFRGHSKSIEAVAISPDGEYVASASWDYTVRVWNVATGKPVSDAFEGHTDIVTSVAFSPNGKSVVSGSWDRSVRLWETRSGDLVSGPFLGHEMVVNSVAYSPNGKHVASGSWDSLVCIWDTESGHAVFAFRGHTDRVRSIAFSPNGRWLVSGSDDCSIRIWNVEHGRIVSTRSHGKMRAARSTNLSNGEAIRSSSKKNAGVLPTAKDESTMTNWALFKDGWIRDNQDRLLIWIPPIDRPTVWHPRNTAIFSCRFSTRLDFSDSVLGTDWARGFSLEK